MANDLNNGQKREGRHLRKEATNVKAERLTSGQGNAMVKVLDLLQDSLKYSRREFEVAPRNRILLLDGDRGSGKSTIVHTLRHWMDPDDKENIEIEREALRLELLRDQHEDVVLRAALRRKQMDDLRLGLHGDAFDEAKLVGSEDSILARILASKMIREVDWLEPLSLDPLARATNLLAAILSRVLQKAHNTVQGGDSQRRQGVLDEPGAVDRALHELDSLRNSAVMAVEGNLASFEARMDPESYSTQVNDVEGTKLTFSRKLNRILGDIVAGAGRNSAERQGVFVLAIEDVDMRPGRAAEVLRLVYSLKVPRLVFLLVGSGDRLEEALRLAYEQELTQLAQNPDHDELVDIERKATELAASGFRKMLPLHHRVKVEDMKRVSALALPTGGLDDTNLGSALAKVRATGVTTLAPGGAALSLLTLLRTHYYSGGEVLDSPPRSVVDFAETIDEVGKAKSAPEQAETLIRELSEDFKALIDEDADLGRQIQAIMRVCVRPERQEYVHLGKGKKEKVARAALEGTGSNGGKGANAIKEDKHANYEDGRRWELVPPPDCCIRFEVSDETDVDLYADPSQFVRAAAHIAHIEDVLVGVGPVKLGHRSEAMFKLIHDVIRLGFVDGEVTRTIAPEFASPYASTRWTVGAGEAVRVPWISVAWPTFLHRDAFAVAWNEGIDKVHEVIQQDSAIGGQEHAAHAVLATAVALLRAVGIVLGQEKTAGLDVGPGVAEVELGEDEPVVFREPEGVDGEWRFVPGCGSRLAVRFVKLGKEWLDKHLKNHDDPLTEAQLDILVDVACLCTPEVWPGNWDGELKDLADGVWGPFRADISLVVALLDAERSSHAAPGLGQAPTYTSAKVGAALRTFQERIVRRRLERVAKAASPLTAIGVLSPATIDVATAAFESRALADLLRRDSNDRIPTPVPSECEPEPQALALWFHQWLHAQSMPRERVAKLQEIVEQMASAPSPRRAARSLASAPTAGTKAPKPKLARGKTPEKK